MEFLNKLLAGLIAKFKTDNPKIFGGVVAALVAVYVGLELLIGYGFVEDALLVRITQYIDVVFMTIMGSKTAPWLKEYLNQVHPAQAQQPDSWWTSIIDGFKMKSPIAFGITATVLLTFFVGSQYAIHFNVVPPGSVATVLKIASYVDIGVLILLGSRTEQYLKDNPFQTQPGVLMKQSLESKVLWFD